MTTGIDSNVERVVVPVGPWLHDLLAGQNQLLVQMLTELRHIRHALGDGAHSRSSVEIKAGTNGRPFDYGVRAYEGSDVLEPESAAVQSFMRLRAELEARLMDGWRQTVEAKGK